MRSRTVAVLLAIAFSMACGRRHLARVEELGLYDPCSEGALCRDYLICQRVPEGDLQCLPGETQPLGAPCVLSMECEDDPAPNGLYCSFGVCAPAGPGVSGEVCGSSADCQHGLYCAFAGFGGTCRTGGQADLDDFCNTIADCTAGLVCDPLRNECASTYSEPFGQACLVDEQCRPEVGIFCEATTGTCSGHGPDGLPVIPWGGATSCTPTNELVGNFRVMFVVPTAPSDDFYRLPFPNDILVTGGTVDLAGHPEPPSYAVPMDLFGRYLSAAFAEQTGYGPNQSVFLRFSGPPKFCERGCGGGSPCATGCMGPGEPAQSLYVVDLTRESFACLPTCNGGADDGATCSIDDDCTGGTCDGATECDGGPDQGNACTSDGDCALGNFAAFPFTPITYRWFASTGRSSYICWNWLAVVPSPTRPWVPGHTYFVFVHTRIQGAGSQSMQQDGDFTTMLAAADPGGNFTDAWSVYEPLRAWLASSPSYPVTGDPVGAADLGGGALFTIRDPKLTLTALGDAIEASAAASFADLVVCNTPSAAPDCTNPASQDFTEVQGEVALTNYQSGTAPYVDAGGNIALSGGVPQARGSVDVRLAISIPDGTPPAGGWPVIIYSHGTGGSYRSHIDKGLAALFTATHFDDQGACDGLDETTCGNTSGCDWHAGVCQSYAQFAVLGIDQVAHGARAGDWPYGNDLLFFNYANPRAAKGNVLQAAADQLLLVRSIGALSTALMDAGVMGAAGELNPTAVAYLGHSQGGIVGAVAMARAPTVEAVAFSGAGGLLLHTLTQKTSPYDLPTIMRGLLNDPTFQDAALHPAMSIIQGYLEEADPVNYGRHLSHTPLAGSAPKHVLQLVGIWDTFTPNDAGMTLARRIGVDFYDDGFSWCHGGATPDAICTQDSDCHTQDDTSGRCAGLVVTGDSEETPPIRNNRGGLTRVGVVQGPDQGEDGHFVFFDIAAAKDRVAAFFSSWFTDADHDPTVVD